MDSFMIDIQIFRQNKDRQTTHPILTIAIDRQTDRLIDILIDIDRQTDRQIDRQINIHSDRYRYIDRQTDIQID